MAKPALSRTMSSAQINVGDAKKPAPKKPMLIPASAALRSLPRFLGLKYHLTSLGYFLLNFFLLGNLPKLKKPLLQLLVWAQ